MSRMHLLTSSLENRLPLSGRGERFSAKATGQLERSPRNCGYPPKGIAFRHWLLLAWACLALACGSQLPFVWVYDLPKDTATRTRTELVPGDAVLVVIKDQKDLSGEFPVRDDGSYLQPLLGSVKVEGLTAQQVAEQLAKKLSSLVQNPHVTVSLVARRPLHVSVTGEVRAPGAFEVAHDSTVLGVIARAGGFTEFATLDDIYVVRRTPKLARIRFTRDLLVEPNGISTHFRLRDGDVIVAE